MKKQQVELGQFTGTGIGQERVKAHSRGHIRYFTGRPCIHGHIAERYVLSGNCIECLTISQNRNRSLKEHLVHGLTHGTLSKKKAEAWGSPWYCTGVGLPCGHAHWQRTIDDACKLCLEQEGFNQQSKIDQLLA